MPYIVKTTIGQFTIYVRSVSLDSAPHVTYTDRQALALRIDRPDGKQVAEEIASNCLEGKFRAVSLVPRGTMRSTPTADSQAVQASSTADYMDTDRLLDSLDRSGQSDD